MKVRGQWSVVRGMLLATLCVGCQPVSLFPVAPNPQIESKPVSHTLTIKVEDGKLTIGDGTLNVKSESLSEVPKRCPCCGVTGVCRGLCGKVGCLCSRGDVSAVPTVGNVVALPQTRTEMVYQCRNGVCGWYPVPVATDSKRSATATIHGGKITIYDHGSPAGRAMRESIGTTGVDWKRSESPVAINGVRWSPTAVKPDGSAWTPGANGWHSQSAAQFDMWRRGP